MNSIRATVIEVNHTLPKITHTLNLEIEDAAVEESCFCGMIMSQQTAFCAILILQMFSSNATGVKNHVKERSDCRRLFFLGGASSLGSLPGGGRVGKALVLRAVLPKIN